MEYPHHIDPEFGCTRGVIINTDEADYRGVRAAEAVLVNGIRSEGSTPSTT